MTFPSVGYVGEVSNTTFLSKIQDAVVVDSRVDIGDDEPTVSSLPRNEEVYVPTDGKGT
jgi:hypothetical protein